MPAINLCVDNEPLKVNFIEGTPFVGASTLLKAGPGDGHRGELIAWDAVSGTRAWSIPERFPVYGDVLATAGNLVFYGTLDRWFRAVEATTGRVLFEKQLPSGIIGNPMTFTGPDGKQRVDHLCLQRRRRSATHRHGSVQAGRGPRVHARALQG